MNVIRSLQLNLTTNQMHMSKYVYDGLAGGLAWDQAWYNMAGMSGLQNLQVVISDSPHPLKGEKRLKVLRSLMAVRQTKRFVVAVD